MTYPLAYETVDENGMTHSFLRLPACMKSIETNQLDCAEGQRKWQNLPVNEKNLIKKLNPLELTEVSPAWT